VVRRHLDLVYCAALRQVRSRQLAEEVAQAVFTDLARKARRLAPDTMLTAWLYQVTRRTAIDVVRRETRRQLRQQIASEMNAMNATVPSDWTHIEPLLDEAMSALGEIDRAAILLRYFENKSLRDVGSQLGTSEDAAQKRVSRAVERLREFFAKRGVTVGTSGLVAVVATNAVQAAPVGLTFTISAAAAAFVETTLAATTTAAATKAIAMTILQKTLITIAVAALIAVPTIQYQRTHKDRYLARANWKDAGQITPEAALETYFWAGRDGNLARYMQTFTAPQTTPPGPAEAEAGIKNEFGQIQGVRVQPFSYETKEVGWFTADWILENGKTRHPRSKWRRVGKDWKLVNDEPVPAVSRK